MLSGSACLVWFLQSSGSESFGPNLFGTTLVAYTSPITAFAGIIVSLDVVFCRQTATLYDPVFNSAYELMIVTESENGCEGHSVIVCTVFEWLQTQIKPCTSIAPNGWVTMLLVAGTLPLAVSKLTPLPSSFVSTLFEYESMNIFHK